jgi:D-alanyl-lipoteichoic acid acyltransferase DltB (MBOAT superfamily)
MVYVMLFVYLRDYEFLHWLLPEWTLRTGAIATVGISFLLFKVLHTAIEARSGTLGPVDPLSYANYCLNFTVFMMGPIQRYQDYRAQWTGQERAIPLTFEAHLDAVVRILVGLFKAYVVAALIAPYALNDSADLLMISRAELIGRIVAFYFFLYVNFAGYCDVAIGLGSLLGVRPPENFDKPFLARNIADFWQRFHRSLTQWLTTYVFSPSYKWALEHRIVRSMPLLAMNGALVLTMLVSGLWHGTTTSFLIFGMLHGLYFLVYRSWESWATGRFGKKELRTWRSRRPVQFAGVLVTFSAVCVSLIFFQLPASRALAVLGRLTGL